MLRSSSMKSKFNEKWYKIRYVTKSKNCSGFMKVDQILKVWSLLSPKIYFPKIGGTKKTTYTTTATLL